MAQFYLANNEYHLYVRAKLRLLTCSTENGRCRLVLLGNDGCAGYLPLNLSFHGSQKRKSGKTTKAKLPLDPLFICVRPFTFPLNVFFNVVRGNGSHLLAVCNSDNNVQSASL